MPLTTTINAAFAAAKIQERLKSPTGFAAAGAIEITVDGDVYRLDVAQLIRETEPVNLARFVTNESEAARGRAHAATLCKRCLSERKLDDGDYCLACADRVEDANDHPRRR